MKSKYVNLQLKLFAAGLASAAVLVGLAPLDASAQGAAAPEGEHHDMSAVGAKLANPLSDLWALNFNVEGLKFYDGDANSGDPQLGSDVIFQPILPFPLYGEGKEEWRLVIRPVIPLIFSAPTPGSNGGFNNHSGIGDIQVPLVFALPSSISGKWILGAGPVMQFPTASDKNLGSRQYGVGPAIVLGYKAKKSTSVLFLNYLWKSGEAGQSSNTPDLNQGTLLYSFIYNLPQAWQVGLDPTISYNEQASSGNQWNIPIGIFVGRTVKYRNKPVNIKLGFEYSVVSEDDFGKRAMLRLQITPIIQGLLKNPIFGK
jgi:hypothetical protein